VPAADVLLALLIDRCMRRTDSIGAGIIVIDTESSDGEIEPRVQLLASSTLAIETPELPTFRRCRAASDLRRTA